jgi:hypothetical protein
VLVTSGIGAGGTTFHRHRATELASAEMYGP